MNEQRPTEAAITELSEEELTAVAAGTANFLLKIDGIKGESQDDKHKDEIHISS